jgi:hypothetical protein
MLGVIRNGVISMSLASLTRFNFFCIFCCYELILSCQVLLVPHPARSSSFYIGTHQFVNEYAAWCSLLLPFPPSIPIPVPHPLPLSSYPALPHTSSYQFNSPSFLLSLPPHFNGGGIRGIIHRTFFTVVLSNTVLF